MLGFGFDMSERMSEDMSESMWKDMSEDMSERVSKDLSERMSKDMSERMSEDMSERMSEDMSECSQILHSSHHILNDNPHLTTSTQHVMVGITRSKVIFFWFLFSPFTFLTF